MTGDAAVASPQDCLEAADQLLANLVKGARGSWPRGSAWLLRLALEAAMDDYWRRVRPEVLSLRARQPQFLILDRYAGRSLATRAAYTWWALSRAGHHHCYELGLTSAELAQLRQEVTTIVADLAAGSTAERPPQQTAPGADNHA